MKAYQVMKTDVLTVGTGTSAEAVARLSAGHRSHSVPMRDDDNQRKGIVSGADLIQTPAGLT